MLNNKTAEGLLKAAPVDWQDHVNRIINGEAGIEHLPPVKDRETLDECIRSLDCLIQSAARLRGYLDGRYGHGCGDQGHADSVKESNKLCAKIRKALGYTQAKIDVQF